LYRENLGISKAEDRDLTAYGMSVLLFAGVSYAMICPFFSGSHVADISSNGSDAIIGPSLP